MKKCVYKKICKVYNRKKCSSKYSYENNNCSLVDIKIDKKIIKKSIEKNNNGKLLKNLCILFLFFYFLTVILFFLFGYFENEIYYECFYLSVLFFIFSISCLLGYCRYKGII